MTSLRLRFTVAVLLGQLVLLGVGTYIANRIGTTAMTRQFDEALMRQASILASLLEQEGRHVGIELDETYMREYFSGDDPDYFQLYYQGISFGRSPALDDRDLPLRFGTFEKPEIWNDALPDGRPGRCIGIAVTVSEVEPDPRTGAEVEGAEVTLILATSRARLEQLSALLLYGLFGGDVVLLICGLAVMWVVVTRSLGPIRVFAQRVGSVDVHTLGQPLDPEEVPSELQPIVAGVNDLLTRLDATLRTERRAASNMAHELITPISELRTLSEIALQEGSDAAYREHALGQAHEISVQMANLIKMVRQLTLVDARTQALPGGPIPLAPLVDRVITAFRECATAKRLHIDVDVDGEVVDCNRDALWSVCNNLLGNAVEYTPEGGRIKLRTLSTGPFVTIQIINDCRGLRAEHIPHLTEPFWRLSSSRSDASHHGLGLTIAQGMAVLAGIELRFRIEGSCFVAEAIAPTEGTREA